MNLQIRLFKVLELLDRDRIRDVELPAHGPAQRRKRAAATEFLSDVGTERTVKGENGEYLVRTNEDGYTITKKGEEGKQLDLVYNEENRTWSAVSEGESYELITMNEDGTVTVKMQDGTPLTVTPDMQGLSTARAASGQSLFFAAR